MALARGRVMAGVIQCDCLEAKDLGREATGYGLAVRRGIVIGTSSFLGTRPTELPAQ